VNPPLRTQQDVQALREAVADGTIDIVATDHAPHTKDSKDCEWGEAAFGMLGLETAAAIVQTTLVDTGLISWSRFEEVLSTNPAKIGKLTDQGQPIAVGSFANLVLIDSTRKQTIGLEGESKSANNPYVGMELNGVVMHTLYKGTLTVKDGVVQKLGETND
jgi:dihydroorotase